MPKLLIATTIPETIEAFLLPYVQHFQQAGWIVDGMAHCISNSTVCCTAFHHVWDIPWSRNPLSLQNFQAALPKIREIAEQGQYDLVHVHTPVAAFITRFALQQFRTQQNLKVIYTAHGFHFHPGGSLVRNLIFSTLEKWAGAWTDELIVINREDEAAAHKLQLVPPKQICYMPGIGIDLAQYSREQVSATVLTALRQSIGLTPEDQLFLVIAELSLRKRPCDILNAFAQLKSSTIHLAFAGDGSLKDILQQRAKNLQISERVHFLGFRSDIPALICASVATLLVSQQEGLPRSIMESLALEVPVIGSDIRGIRDLLSPNGGLLVEVGNIAGITQAMDWLLTHPQAAQEMGREGRKQMEFYSLQHTLTLHQALYTKVLTR